jgi:uroporphyrinogen-III synthase
VSQTPTRILITRSEPGAGETAERIRNMGFTPIVEPVFAIEAIDVQAPGFDALAFTSANGVRQFAKLSPRRDVDVFCVGVRTAEAAREAGYARVLSAEADVNGLAELIFLRLPGSKRLLHAGNEESRGDLSGRLKAAGYQASFLAIFRPVPVTTPGPALAAHIAGERAFEAVLIHSPRAAAILANLGKASRLPFDIAAISSAAAAPLAAKTGRSEVAGNPDEQSLLSALSRLVTG